MNQSRLFRLVGASWLVPLAMASCSSVSPTLESPAASASASVGVSASAAQSTPVTSTAPSASATPSAAPSTPATQSSVPSATSGAQSTAVPSASASVPPPSASSAAPSSTGATPPASSAPPAASTGVPTAEPSAVIPAEASWIGAWGTAPQLVESGPDPDNRPLVPLVNNTLRQVVFPTISGTKVRLEISNEWGNAPLELKSVHLAKAGTAGAIDVGTDTPLTFAGSESATVAAQATLMSDAVDFDLTALERVTISIAFGSVPVDTALSGHPGSRTNSYIQTGNAVTTADLTSATATAHWYFITKLETETTDPSAGAIAILGDSITDGRGSTSAGVGLDQRWPDYLARKLQANPATKSVSVLNMGIGGNTVLSGGLGPTAKDRFTRDILGQSGVKWLIVLEGINDIGNASSDLSQQLITAYQSFIDQAKAANIKAYGMPLTPFGGSSYATGTNGSTHVTIFNTVNTWIRSSGEYDAVIDMDATLSDPANPTQLKSAYLFETDYLHLNVEGYEAMGGAIDLSLFQ